MVNNPLTIALFESFRNWGSKDPTFKKTYKKLKDPAFDIVLSALDEINIHTPGQYDFWWCKSHMRWFKIVPDQQARWVHELMYNFLTKYSRGELYEINTGNAKKAKRTRANEARRVE